MYPDKLNAKRYVRRWSKTTSPSILNAPEVVELNNRVYCWVCSGLQIAIQSNYYNVHQQKTFPSRRNACVRVDALRQSRQRHPGDGLLRARRQYHTTRCISPSDHCFGPRLDLDWNAMGDAAKISAHVPSTLSSRSRGRRWEDIILPGRKDPRNWADPRNLGKSKWDQKLGKIVCVFSLYDKMRW
jgi:hypothetical protein